MIVLAAAVLLVVAIGYGLHRLALWAEDRGYVYYKHKRRPPGHGLGLLAQIYAPQMEHVVEEAVSERIRGEERESGRDDPDRDDDSAD